jgi:hypothetical protein
MRFRALHSITLIPPWPSSNEPRSKQRFYNCKNGLTVQMYIDRKKTKLLDCKTIHTVLFKKLQENPRSFT